MWDRQYSIKYSRIFPIIVRNRVISYGILPVPHNIIMDMNNVVCFKLSLSMDRENRSLVIDELDEFEK